MRRLKVFNNVSLDGYICDASGDMGWAHQHDPEWLAFTRDNAQGDAEFLFGRRTHDMMASFWPTPFAREANPELAARMNGQSKLVFSRTLTQSPWQNTRVVRGELVAEVQALKAQAGPDLLVFGSANLVAQLSAARLVDSYQLVVHPLALGGGRTMFEGLGARLALALTDVRRFANGNVVLWYELAR